MVQKTFTQGQGAGVFIVSESNHTRSREEGTLAQGHVFTDGAMVKMSAGKLVPVTNDDLSSEGDVADFAGFVIGNFDTSSATGINADWPHVPYLARDAEVNIDEMPVPEESTEGGETDAYKAFWATKGIIVRDSGGSV